MYADAARGQGAASAMATAAAISARAAASSALDLRPRRPRRREQPVAGARQRVARARAPSSSAGSRYAAGSTETWPLTRYVIGVQETRAPARRARRRQRGRGAASTASTSLPSTVRAVDAVRARPRRRALARGQRSGRRRRRPAVVLADEQHRQAEDLRPVQRFDERAAVDRAVAEEARDDLGRRRGSSPSARRPRRSAAPRQPRRWRRACRRRSRRCASTRRLPPQLPPARPYSSLHHPADVGALGERVAVAAVRGREVVRAAQIGAHAGGDGLLARRQVQRPAHGSRLRGRLLAEDRDAAAARLFCGVLERANAQHRRVERRQSRPPRVVPCHALTPRCSPHGLALSPFVSRRPRVLNRRQAVDSR